MWRDKLFYFFLILGPVFWAFLFFFIPITKNLFWPANEPLYFAMVVFAFPFVEEVVFRGLIQDYFNYKFKSKKIGILTYANGITSIIFTALHFLFHPLLWALLIIFPSVIFGFAKERFSNLTAPVLLHIFYNLGFFWLFK